MAQYTITHSCGHQQVHNIVGRDTRFEDGTTRRQYIAAKRAEGKCGDCARADLDEQRIAATETATEQAAAEGLPALTGSEKQIAWAERIRQGTIAILRESMTRVPEHLVPAAMEIYMGIIGRQVQASWWIDARDLDGNAAHPGVLKQVATDDDRAALKDLFPQAKARTVQPYATPSRETVTTTIPKAVTLTAREAAEKLGVSLSTIYRRCRSGALAAAKADRRWTITL